MSYRLARPLLFMLDPEKAHAWTLSSLNLLASCGLEAWVAPKIAPLPRRVMNINFTNPIGLAAGLDKNGDYLDGLAALGWGYLEVGTVTPRAQSGNPTPRLYRLPQASALINRMGFNNCGVDHLLQQLRTTRYRGVLGINIGKNFDTPIEHAANDYLICLRKVYPFASYVTVNISSPNTQNLRQLQSEEELAPLLAALKSEQQRLADAHRKYVPLAVKIAPDLDEGQIATVAALLLEHRIDAVIATNTTVARPAVVAGVANSEQPGGMSGGPLKPLALRVIRVLKDALNEALPIIGVGGVMSGDDALEMLDAGAQLVQVYTGLIYRGPGLIAEIADAIAKRERLT